MTAPVIDYYLSVSPWILGAARFRELAQAIRQRLMSLLIWGWYFRKQGLARQTF